MHSCRHDVYEMESEREGLDKLVQWIAPPRFAVKRACYALSIILFFGALLRYREGSEVLQSLRYGGANPYQGEQTLTLDLSHLEKYKLSTSFSYSRRSIQAKRADGVRTSLTIVNESLYSTPQVSIVSSGGNLSSVPVTTLPPLTLYFPSDHRSSRFSMRFSSRFTTPFTQPDTSIISFGIATQLDRLNDSILQLSHWLSGSEAALHLLVPEDDTSGNKTALEKTMRDLKINATISTTNLETSHAYFSLVKHLYETRPANAQWLALFDDDTFVPSLPKLAAHLSKNYDASTQKLVGALTDNFRQINSWGLIPFGGGGIFLSVPLAALISSPEIFDDCILSRQIQGDGILNECLQKYSYVRPTYDPDLNQMDIRGDPSGLFESGRRMLTIHHWKTWFSVDMPKVAKISESCGDESILMRFNFENGVVLTNGYSIAEYPKGIERINLEAVEKTWDGPPEDYIHRIGPLRDPLPIQEKKSYKMLDTVVLDDVGILQTYVYKAPVDANTKSTKGEDGVIELLWPHERLS